VLPSARIAASHVSAPSFGSVMVMENLKGRPSRSPVEGLSRNSSAFFALPGRRAPQSFVGEAQQMLAIGRGIASSPRPHAGRALGTSPMVADLISNAELPRRPRHPLVEQRVAEASILRFQLCSGGWWVVEEHAFAGG
jgi:hypothetical protein